MLLRILNVGQRVKGQKLRSATKFRALSIKILFKVILFFFKLFFVARTMLLIVMRVVDENDKVDSQVKLQLLRLKVLFKTLLGGQHKLLPRFKEIVLCSLVKAHGKSVQKLRRILNRSVTCFTF